ncbi:hypothetical protein [Propionivibrio dicarboxylicus]|uniref:Uncharacterized protein n=1 Tax=Propionivibrio dicarboxylicus TaxID=83767 RepID=A0A1G8C9R1_9RHOO|nr:hypothetical protein [Propionivibrio dicarboxylicus]SDH42049.1 hypothetical protein SAMN05660652_01711 [Propionivibrio dicarboxylicus]
MFPMTITLSNNAQLAAVLSVLGGPQLLNPPPEPTEPAKKSALAKTEVAVVIQPTATAEAGAAQETKAAASDTKPASTEGKTFTIDDAKALTMKIVGDKGRDAAVALLDKYAVKVAAKLPADKVAEFCTDAQKVLAQ